MAQLGIVRPHHTMKLVEHLEYVIGLVERSASKSEIKGALLGMREEVEGQQQATANQIKLNKKHADEMSALKEKHLKANADRAKLKAEIAQRDSQDAIGFSGVGGYHLPDDKIGG